MTAAKIKAMTMKAFCFRFKNITSMMPRRPKTMRTMGNSKAMPKGNVKVIKNDKYDSRENMGSSVLVAKPMKNWMASGKTRKKEKARPR